MNTCGIARFPCGSTAFLLVLVLAVLLLALILLVPSLYATVFLECVHFIESATKVQFLDCSKVSKSVFKLKDM